MHFDFCAWRTAWGRPWELKKTLTFGKNISKLEGGEKVDVSIKTKCKQEQMKQKNPMTDVKKPHA